MQKNEALPPNVLYTLYLRTIQTVNFTQREVDVVACLLNGRSSKKISSFLNISPRTVDSHIRNISHKLECYSREGIIDFIEKSEEYAIVKNYYSNLVINAAFEKNLKEISEANKIGLCRLAYNRDLGEEVDLLFHQIKSHLLLVVEQLPLEVIKDRKDLQKLSSHTGHILYVLSNKLLKRLHINEDDAFLKSFSQPQDNLNQYKALYLLLENAERKLDALLPQDSLITFKDRDNYYLSFFKLLKQLCPSQNFEDYVQEIASLCEKNSFSFDIQRSLPNSSIKETEHVEHPPLDKRRRSFLNWKHLTIGILVPAVFSSVSFILFKRSKYIEELHLIKNPQGLYIQSGLSVPMESFFLNRPELIAQIDNTFKGGEGIQSTALVGIGGAGKTTLARQYAHQQKAPVIWEINAETQETLKASFEDLAQEVSKTEEEQKILRGLLDIKNPEEKEKKILNFVKEGLRISSNWFLIFDNVEKFTDIQNYFPQDSSIWGSGKILLTTRDRNIQNNSRLNHVVPIEELTHKQKLDVFTKIMNHGTNAPLPNTHPVETEKFLENIPSFPLDVSVAAYYLKSTNTSYEGYLESLKKYDVEFSSVQESLLKEAGSYLKTRYGIITLSLERLIKSHKDFGELLLFISLLDSQNIPKDLLDKHKSKLIVDNFIYHLKKYSLITADVSGVSAEPIFSIHRSTQAITLSYLTKKLDLLKNNKTLHEICDTFVKYSVDSIYKGDFRKQSYLLNHCIALLNHNNLLTDFMKTSISGELGGLYCHQGFYAKAKEILETTLQTMDKKYHILYTHVSIYLGKLYSSTGNYKKARDLFENNIAVYNKRQENNLDFPRTLTHLGKLYRKTGDYKKAKISLEHALKLFKAHLSDNHELVLWTSINLGYIYLEQGEFEKSRVLLEQSLRIYKQSFPENYTAAAEILQRLGVIYRDLGYYEKATNLFQLCIKNYSQDLSENHLYIADPLAHLASVYIELNNYEKAKKLLEKSLNIYKKHVSGNHVYAALALRYLGNAYAGLKDYQTAKHYLQKNLKIYTEQYGETHLKTAYVLRDLGRVHLLENHIEIAEKFLGRALEIFQMNKHPDVYTCLENLAELSHIKSRFTGHKDKVDQANSFNTQTRDYLKQALDVVKIHFPADSPHIIRIESKIKKLTAG